MCMTLVLAAVAAAALGAGGLAAAAPAVFLVPVGKPALEQALSFCAAAAMRWSTDMVPAPGWVFLAADVTEWHIGESGTSNMQHPHLETQVCLQTLCIL